MIAWLSWSSVKCSNAAAASAAAAAAAAADDDDDDDDGAAAAAVGAAAAADVGAGAGADGDGSADADADGSGAVAMPADDTDSEDLPVMTVFEARIRAESRRRSDFGGVKPLEPSSCLDRCGLSLILLGLRANRGRDSTTREEKELATVMVLPLV